MKTKKDSMESKSVNKQRKARSKNLYGNEEAVNYHIKAS